MGEEEATIHAITLMQPWASLIAVGAKRIETRGWRTSYRGPLVIHAGRTWPAYAKAFAYTSRVVRARLGQLEAAAPAIPFGAIVAVGRLVDCVPTESIITDLSEEERALGNYAPGRWAWRLADVRPVTPPIPARGAMGLWDYHGAIPA